ncbi:hypothetical protein [Pseudarthrobacter phenanthrenivorans]|uniref:hypothetical protein n=1 Tax=Pseudarthrobacter phenanthrenivorans TaxID=361575 RepID=UPI0020B8C1CA|nr:hypothetical protein [Pseudarthrobacter phenanthrenivorans]
MSVVRCHSDPLSCMVGVARAKRGVLAGDFGWETDVFAGFHGLDDVHIVCGSTAEHQ